jgi:hypothetical protein
MIKLIILLLCLYSHKLCQSNNIPKNRAYRRFQGFTLLQQLNRAEDEGFFLSIRSKTKAYFNKSALVKNLKAFIERMDHDLKHIFSHRLEDDLLHSFYHELDEDDRQFFNSIDEDNDEALKLLYNLVATNDGWAYVANNSGVLVERRLMSAGPFVSSHDAEKGFKHACVKSTAVLNASAEDVFNIFLNTERSKEYNEHIATIKDLYQPTVTPSTKQWSKVSYATGPPLALFKARDFCSVVNYIKLPDQSFVILNRPAYFSKVKPTKKFVRATILLAGNIIKPLGPKKSEIIMLAHVNPGGAADTKAAAFFINQLCAMGPPTFLRKLEIAANKKSSSVQKSIGS